MLNSFWFRSIGLFLASASALNAAEFDVDSLQKEIYSTIESVKPAVVSLRGRGVSFSGVIVSKEGHILSAGHAVRSGVQYQVQLPDGRRMTARGKGTNPQADCALLQMTNQDEDLPFAEMGESKSLVRNQPCVGISFPGGQGTREVPNVRFGHLLRAPRGSRMLQSSALMEPGDSGGPLFDLQGRVIGIHSRIGRRAEQNYEVPIDTFKQFWNELNREESFTESGPPMPTLGFRGRVRTDNTGVDVSEVIKDSLAEKHGLLAKDIIQSVYGKVTPNIFAVRRALVAARDEDAQEIIVKVLREEEEIELTVAFDVDRKSAPKVEMIHYEEKEFPAPTAIAELANLPKHFSDLESELDDVCVEIASTRPDGEELAIVGTRIKATPFIVSKSSMVAEKPMIEALELEVVARDSQNDLVLLKSTKDNSVGVDINGQAEDVPSMGSFLLAPDADGAGAISIVSTTPFTSRKQQSRGYLGVVPANHKDKDGVVLTQITNNSAAERAGLKVGDIVTKLNETVIDNRTVLRSFLSTLDPNATVVAVITRDDKELEKTIKLGSLPSRSNHAADRMDKSDRRDGFSTVIPHDADLKPEDCGGPIFDLDGNFLGLNIARNSRVRSYMIPRTVIEELVDRK